MIGASAWDQNRKSKIQNRKSHDGMLTPEQIDRYGREGVLAPAAALAASEAARYRAAVEELEMFAGGRLEPNRTKQLHLHFPWAYELALHPTILDAVESILGPDILVHDTSLFAKHPHDEQFVSWHQDGYYQKLSAARFVSAWVALSDSTPANGCMRVLVGSHTEPLPHAERPSPNNMLGSGITVATEIDEARVRDVALAPGEISLHHVNIVHGSGMNRTNGKRVGFAIRYVATDVRQELPHHDVLLARGRDTHGHYKLATQIPSGSLAECFERQRAEHEKYMERRREGKR
jgi:ectoine hydroxylase-related dioxygenase (phytanoyl-CoA dioxygenase family)